MAEAFPGVILPSVVPTIDAPQISGTMTPEQSGRGNAATGKTIASQQRVSRAGAVSSELKAPFSPQLPSFEPKLFVLDNWQRVVAFASPDDSRLAVYVAGKTIQYKDMLAQELKEGRDGASLIVSAAAKGTEKKLSLVSSGESGIRDEDALRLEKQALIRANAVACLPKPAAEVMIALTRVKCHHYGHNFICKIVLFFHSIHLY